MGLISKTNSCTDRSILALLSAYQKYLVTPNFMSHKWYKVHDHSPYENVRLSVKGLCSLKLHVAAKLVVMWVIKKYPLQIVKIRHIEMHRLVFPWTDYALHFPNKGVSDYANIWGMRSLTQFTVCFWMKSSATSTRGTPFSYNYQGMDNALLIYDYTDFHLWVGGTKR